VLVKTDHTKRPRAAFNVPPSFSIDAHKRNAHGERRCVARVCRECGIALATRRGTAQFCGSACRQQFHNRKLARAAIAVDLLMAWRFDRAAFEMAGGRTLLCRIVAAFRAEDWRDRAGRRSWDDPRLAKQRSARFLSIVVGRGVAGVKRRGRAR
jgi:hypothetical protein